MVSWRSALVHHAGGREDLLRDIAYVVMQTPQRVGGRDLFQQLEDVTLRLSNPTWSWSPLLPYAASTEGRGEHEQEASANPSGVSWRSQGWRPIAFTLQFEEGFAEAFDWIYSHATQEELDSLCAEARARLRANRSVA